MEKYFVQAFSLSGIGMEETISIFSLVKKTAAFSLVFVLGCSVMLQGQNAVTVTSDRNPACAGQVVTFTATFNSQSNGGNLIFKDGGTQISTVITVPSGAMSVNFSTSTLTLAGSPHTITAEFTASPLPTVISPAFSQIVSPLPSPPTSPVNNSRCGTGTVTISATPGAGTTIDWYADLTGGSPVASGTGVSTFNTPSISATTTYYAEARNTSTNCVSPTRTAVTATINAVPAVPSVGTGSFSRCGPGEVALTATVSSGETIDWYAAATGGTVLSAGSAVTSFTTPSISATTTYYAETRNTSTNCVSATRAAVTATVNPVPAAPTAGAGPFERCGTGTMVISATVAGGETIDWYAAATGGSPLAGGTGTASFTTPGISETTTYYAEAKTTAGCVSATRTAVTATINPVPGAPTAGAGPFTRCGTGTVTISATIPAGETVDWYAAATGGTVLAGGSGVTSFTTPAISETTTYYAEARNTTTNCVSARTAVTATVIPIPTAPTAGAGPFLRCGTGTVTLTATVGGGETIDWYAAATGGSPLAGGTGTLSFTTPSISATTTYYAEAKTTSGGCVSPTRTAITATVIAIPATPTAGAGPFSRCGTGTVTLTATVGGGETIDWYAAAIGGSPLAGGTGTLSFSTPSISGTTTYYAETKTTTGGCVSATRTAITATITPTPAAPTAGAGPFLRCGNGTVTLTATVGGSETIDWYANATGGSPLAGGTGTLSFTTPSISATTTYYAEAKTTSGGCVSATRTAITATVTAIPAAPTAGPGPFNRCGAGAVALTATVGGSETIDWYAAATGGSPLAGGTGTLSFTTPSISATTTYYAETKTTTGGCTSATRTAITATVTSSPAAPAAGAGPFTRCGTGTVTLTATVTGSETIDWYAAAAGGSPLAGGTGTLSFTTPSISATTTYYAEARTTSGACVSATRTAITATISSAPAPTFTQIGPLCQNSTAPALPASSTNGITGTWSPATINTATVGSTTYTFTPATGQCGTTATMTIQVTASPAPAFTQIGPLCQNSTAPTLPASSTNGISGTWSPATINTATVGTTTYTFTPAAGQCGTTATMSIVISTGVTPTFDQIGPLCQNATAPALPATSKNGVTGTWSPATIATATIGTTTYTFTPAAGQCGTTTTMSIVISTGVTPTFDQIGPLCQNATAPALPAASKNGVTGTWSPATIATATIGTTTYTFTPAAGQCGTTTTMSIVISTGVTPTFDQIGPLCQNATAPALPAASKNGVTGTWSPTTINTATIGTTTYTFTPAAGQCGTTTTMSIVISTGVTPTFDQIGPLCQNSTAPALPTSSKNGVTGTWSPATISTATVGTTTYTFSPAAGQCGTTATMNVVISTGVTPTFTQIGPLNQGSTPPQLPTTSNNSITGTWSPATINTATAGSTTYTFTPAAGQCATTTTMVIQINSLVKPTFTQIGPLCQNSTPPSLPVTSNNNITGTWSPATISTAALGTTTYTFTPSAGQGATTVTMDIAITALITPIFTQIAPMCQNSTAPALPTISNNNISGTWSPATINTTTAGTTTYTFTPAAGQCGTTTKMDIVITNGVTPTFAQIGPLCQISTPPTLPTTSTNGITGTWNPATINTAIVGTSNYIFTAGAGQCAATVTMTIGITNQVIPTFAQIPPLCQGSPPPTLPATSTNGVTGTWSPATINTAVVGTTTHTFTPSTGQCGTTTTMNIVVTSQVGPTFNTIGPLCLNSTPPALPTTSTNGITGTWSPATINTATAGTSTYTFTQSSGQCATTAALNITITPAMTPTFNSIGPLCQNSSAPSLPVTSTNGITGTWSPATINTTTQGTSTYTFTPTSSQCAVPVSLSITITSQVTPTLNQIGPLCLNSTAPPLPATSTNGITGTWSPATISTTTIGSSSYTFTPTAGQCGRVVTMVINIVPVVSPIFNPIDALCQNSKAPELPATSTNGITGTWNPAVINTSTPGSTTYTFTPSIGQCAAPRSLSVTVNPEIALSFNPIGPFCQGSTASALPATSIEGISGTWSPSTISTASIGTTTYTFTPATGQCGTPATIDIEITSRIVPTFPMIGPFCRNSNPPKLPAISADGFTGTWSPDTINTSIIGTSIYTFTPNAGQCGTTANVSVTITNEVTPIFTGIGPLCQNSPPPLLPTRSTNGIIGTWSPSIINTTTTGTSNYVFTPTANQCGTKTTMDIFITSQFVPTFTEVGSLCQKSTAPLLPSTSNNGIRGTWSPAVINTDSVGTKTYTFTPNSGQQCAAPALMDITVKPVRSSSTTITICTNQLPYSWNGQTFNAAGTFDVTLLSSLACDSIATLELVVKPVLTSTTKVSICPSLLPYTWNGRTYNAGGTYNVTLQNVSGCDSVASLDLTVTPALTSTTDVSICSSELPYTWNGQKYELPGTYSRNLKTPAGCDSIATLKLNLKPVPTAFFNGNTRVCAGTSTTLNLSLSGAGPWTVIYSDGSASHTIDSITVSPYQLIIAPAVTTTYTITSVTSNACTNSSISNPFTINVIKSQPGIRYSTEYAQPNKPKQLQARNIGSNYSYSWVPVVGLDQSLVPNPIFNYDKTTEYTILIRSTIGCLTVDTLLVKVVDEYTGSQAPDLFVPKAWTPNGDGRNDLLFPFPAKIRELKYFRVYNRWGQLMFETKELMKGWNGNYNGKPQAMDAYTWVAEAIGMDGKIIKRSGNSALLR